MTELILHHYPASPFAEKARLMLGFKGLAWRSVFIPPVMPKPDLTALTGGYRRTPVLQRGADVFCDTALIARVLETQAPTPTLFPASAPLAPLLAQWADSTLFWTAVPYTMQPAGLAHVFAGLPPEAVQAFAADRAPFSAGIRRQTVADATVNLRQQLAAFDAQLADGRPFLFGADASIADFAVAHCVWYVHRGGPVAAIVEPFALVRAWLQRVEAFGHGRPRKMSSAEALAAASGAGGHAATAVEPGLGFEPGQRVNVAPTDYGIDPVAGELVGLTADEVVVRRTDERAGTVHVHFPRAGFQLKKEKSS
ncbi:MAG: glutathione S-transferase family protein [Rubrivivax sp.]|nr:glutathione S-transferase family protein [Rubrivivax sp.]